MGIKDITFALLVIQELVWYCFADEVFPFNDPSLSWRERVDDLVSRLTVDEITTQMANGGRTTYAPAIPRLGIPPYSWGVECNRGDIKAGPATSFPQALGLAAAFSLSLIYDVAEATSREVRAKFNNYSSHGYYGMHSGASCWSPVINIMRDPRWGRNQETYGEDPWLSGELAAAFVSGLQGEHPRYIRTNAGCKHFDAYGGPENLPVTRHEFDAQVKEEDLRNTFFPAFRKCIQAGSYSVMCSYNSVNGVPACANKMLLTDVLRSEWGFTGYVISDETAIEDIMLHHNYTTSVEDTVAAAILAGTNIEDGPSPNKGKPFFNHISKAVELGKLKELTIREAVKPLFHTRMRLGLFDPPDMNLYSSLHVSTVVQNEQHRQLALESAMKTFVLLKNSNNVLPIKGEEIPFKHIAFVGPLSDNNYDIFGGNMPEPDPQYITTVRNGLRSLAHHSSWHPGCIGQDTRCTEYDADAVKNAVSGADMVVVSLGTGIHIEKEMVDRVDLQLPGQQLQLLQDAIRYSSEATSIVLLLFNAGPLDISWAMDSPRVQVILECFFPAQATGEALRHTFLGEGPFSNPAGRLPSTWPASADQYPHITNYTMVNRTYRYFQGKPLLPFGYGLSYTNFKYATLDANPSVLQFPNVLLVEVYVQNIGKYDGDEVVQLYASWPNDHLPSTPHLQLVGFRRKHIKTGQGLTFTFSIILEQLGLWNPDCQKYEVVPGRYTLYAGGQQPDQHVTVPSNVLKTSFEVRV